MRLFKYSMLVLCNALILSVMAATAIFPRSSDYSGDTAEAGKVYYAIEINGIVCGYTEASETPVVKEGKEVIEGEVNIFLMLSLLGSEFNTEMKSVSYEDPVTRRNSFSSINIKQGSIENHIEVVVKGDKAVITSTLFAQPREIEISPDITIGSTEVYERLRKDIGRDGKTEMVYNNLEMMEGEIQSSTYKLLRKEKVELAGQTFNTAVIQQTNNKTGVKTTFWMDPEHDYYIKFEVANRKVYLSDQNVIDKIKVANMDENILTKTNKAISDVQSISYMKVSAVIEPTGSNFTIDDLNVPGQKFTGTVKDNHIDGVFEISYPRYDGKDAPPFPPVIDNEQLKKYLTADSRIESNDPLLVEKAVEITEGSTDSWDAAKKLSSWVAENIHYAIPGGGTARKTFDIRAGECGAHSFLLAAFCRAVGIPARVVWGGMYVPNYGGGFGQHGWNEIYMGNAGWIPVDATANENDFVDAGHIRISEYQSLSSSFNGKKFEIVDYRLGDKPTETVEDKYGLYLGSYTNMQSGKTFKVLEKENNLSVDIPGQMVLPFNEPDSKGRWYCKLSPTLYLEFGKNDNEKIDKFILHEILAMTKKSSPEKFEDEVPEDIKPYLGKYLFAQANAEFTLFYKDGTLAVDDPLEKGIIKLQPPDEEGGWKDEWNKNTMFFDKDDKDNVTALKIDVANEFKKGELASVIMQKVIADEGIESAVKKYREMKSAESSGVIFTERDINALGYKLLNENKLTEAVEIFRLNAEEYPESFNVYDSLGDVYMKSGEKKLAVKNYEKSLKLNPKNENAKKMLESLAE